KDNRLPHIAKRANNQIAKTALGAEESINWEYSQDVFELIDNLKSGNFRIIALEQHNTSIKLPDYNPPGKIALLLGEEINGVESELLKKCDDIVEIPMLGTKESFNVSVAAAIALYHLRFTGI